MKLELYLPSPQEPTIGLHSDPDEDSKCKKDPKLFLCLIKHHALRLTGE
jgi:hypothetical protein